MSWSRKRFQGRRRREKGEGRSSSFFCTSGDVALESSHGAQQPLTRSAMSSESLKFVACAFRVTGKVQKVWFRKHTVDRALELQLRGFVQNNLDGSVTGELYGLETNVSDMKDWLKKKGSPLSRIDSAVFEDLPSDGAEAKYEQLPAEFELRRPHLANKK